MVGMIIGLISTIIVMQAFSGFEGQKRTTTSGSDAQTNGGVSLYTLERDIRMAGYGLGSAIGCTVNTAVNTTINRDTAGSSFVLAPVTIVNGTSDAIRILSSNKDSWSVPARVITNHAAPDTTFNTNATVNMVKGDLLIAYEAGQLCIMLQISSPNPVLNPVNFAGTVAPSAINWNNLAVLPAVNYTATSNPLLINVGSLQYHAYSLDANNNLIFTEYNSVTNTSSSQTLAPDVINLQAEYGFDTRVGAQTTFIADIWSADMIDADGSGGTPGDAGDYNRIYAIRFAVAARSGLMEKPDPVTGVCTTTAASPAWAGGILDVSKNPDGTANANWRCYRYKTFETVVPLRNLLWR